MYAIAVVDTQTDTLTLARDPFGIKPLHWRRLHDGSLIFASELRSLVSFPPVPRFNSAAIARFLHLGALAPDMSPFEGVEALAPNTCVAFDRQSRCRIFSILDAEERLISPSFPVTSDIGTVLSGSVKLHMRSDVPIALLLSGGFDSATIASIARRCGRDLLCVTVAGLGGEDETTGAATTAQRYGHEHEVVGATLDEGAIQSFFAAMQRPSIDGLNTFLVSRAIRTCGVKVALSGLGGDEALGGYSHYRLLRVLPLLRILDKAPHPTARVVQAVLRLMPPLRSEKALRLVSLAGPRDAWSLDLLQREVLAPTLVSQLTGVNPQPPSRSHHRADDGSFRALVDAEIELYLQSTLLPDADAFSMRWSVELRVPFVDREVFSAAAVGVGRGKGGKHRLAAALGDSFLESLTRRPKQGFSVPMRAWMVSGPLRPLVDTLESHDAPLWDLVDEQTGRELVRRALPGPRWSTAWSLVALNAWLQSMEWPTPEDPARSQGRPKRPPGALPG